MENYGRCKDCEYGEPTDCSWKWSCTWYHTLEDPDELKDCLFYYIIRYLRIISWSSSTFSTTVP